jgi:hypothetical protein
MHNLKQFALRLYLLLHIKFFQILAETRSQTLFKSTEQNFDINFESQSDMIFSEMPCSLQIFYRNYRASFFADTLAGKRIR